MLASAIPAGSDPVAFDVRFDWRLVAFTAVTSVAAALIAGGLSLRHVLRTDTSAVLSAGSRSIVRGPPPGDGRTDRRADWLFAVAARRHRRDGTDAAQSPSTSIPASTRLTRRVHGRCERPALTDPAQSPAYFSRLYDASPACREVAQITLGQMGLLTRGHDDRHDRGSRPVARERRRPLGAAVLRRARSSSRPPACASSPATVSGAAR